MGEWAWAWAWAWESFFLWIRGTGLGAEAVAVGTCTIRLFPSFSPFNSVHIYHQLSECSRIPSPSLTTLILSVSMPKKEDLSLPPPPSLPLSFFFNNNNNNNKRGHQCPPGSDYLFIWVWLEARFGHIHCHFRLLSLSVSDSLCDPTLPPSPQKGEIHLSSFLAYYPFLFLFSFSFHFPIYLTIKFIMLASV